jgi:uncharacterized protein with HEPN domain
MSSRDPTLTLRQIVEFADEIAALVATRVREDLDTNREFRRALERCVELIGEAATRLPEEWRASHTQIPWRQIIAMRNVMIHGYDVVVADVLWDVATNDVPKLRGAVSALSIGDSKQ